MKELRRSTTDKIFLGVCGGLAEYFNIDSGLVRLAFIFFSFTGGAAFFIYLALIFIMPSDEGMVVDKQTIRNGVDNFKGYLHETFQVSSNESADPASRRRNILGLIIFVAALYTLLYNLNLLSAINYDILWPVFFMLVGIIVFLKKKITMNTIIVLVVVLLILSIVFSSGLAHLFRN